MECVIGNIDYCFVLKQILFNWMFIMAIIIISLIILYIKFRWQIRAWRIKKQNPKHVLTAIFLNLERCISQLPMKVEHETDFTFGKETYTVNKDATFNQKDFKKSVTQMCEELKQYSKQYRLKKGNIIDKIAEELQQLEEYNIKEKAVFHTFHGKKMLSQQTGEAYSLYVDGNPNPLMAEWLLKDTGMKHNAEVIYHMARQNFLTQFLTDSNKLNWKTILLFIGIICAVIFFWWYTQQQGGKLI